MDELNSPITLNEIKNAIDGSKSDSAPYDDEFTVTYLKQGQRELQQVISICYNAMFLFETRPHHLNLRTVKVIPKSGKSKSRKENYRPISLMSVFGKTF